MCWERTAVESRQLTDRECSELFNLRQTLITDARGRPLIISTLAFDVTGCPQNTQTQTRIYWAIIERVTSKLYWPLTTRDITNDLAHCSQLYYTNVILMYVRTGNCLSCLIEIDFYKCPCSRRLRLFSASTLKYLHALSDFWLSA